MCDELMKYAFKGWFQSFVFGSGNARALLVGAEKYALNSSKVMLESSESNFSAEAD